VPRALSWEVYRLVQEALVNASRHSGGSCFRVEVRATNEEVSIAVADDGRGFPFFEELDLDDLDRRKVGPRSLKERVRSLSGRLVVRSTASGSSLEIGLPYAEAAES